MTMNAHRTAGAVLTGADRLLNDGLHLIRNKRIGILTNHTGRLSDGRHLIEAVADSGAARITALFGPEHGIFGDTADGEKVNHGRHPKLDVPVYSLYGKTHKPTREMLNDVDLLLCDIQDVGARFYTFISTIALALEGGAELGVPVLVLDRPNPIRGIAFDGPVRDESLKSFVGWMPLPVTHGMTIGELATMWNNERQLLNGVRAQLEILPMTGWNRSMWYDETGLCWIPPSPNMQTVATATVYPGLCYMEGTSASEGRGTPSAFELIGAPWLRPEKVIARLDEIGSAGVRCTPEEFTPKEIPGIATGPKFEGERCRGIRLHITDRNAIQPVRLGIALLSAIKREHPEEMELRNRRFDILTGTSSVRKLLNEGAEPERITAEWTEGLKRFGDLRAKYLIYS